ncbi:MAG: hypothetical protein M3O33_14490 [Cyanobacteriota bacterium]|nr:hypothetical protein [Cyanobacteriota bacterium]
MQALSIFCPLLLSNAAERKMYFVSGEGSAIGECSGSRVLIRESDRCQGTEGF